MNLGESLDLYYQRSLTDVGSACRSPCPRRGWTALFNDLVMPLCPDKLLLLSPFAV